MSEDILQNYVVRQKSDWTLDAIYKDQNGVVIDVTGYTAVLYLKRHPQQTGAAALQLTTANSKIVVTGPQGKFSITITDSETAGLSGLYYYDLIITSPTGVSSVILEGKVLFQEVSSK